MRTLAKTKDMPYDEWVELRKNSIGGSDAAVILGLNSFKSSYTLWAEKRGYITSTYDNEAMRIGRDLEQYVAERFCEASGKKVHRRNAMFLHDDYDFISANIDREVVGENAGLECKTTSVFAKSDFENGEIPLYYYCQCMHYMAVMGYEKMYLAVLVLGKAFYWFEIERNEDEIENLIKAEADWWNRYILTDEKPDIDGSDSTAKSIAKIYPKDDGSTVSLYGKEDILKAYAAAKTKEKEMKEMADNYKNQLTDLMAEHSQGELDGYVITYKYQERNTVDSKKLKTQFPEIYEECSKKTVSRVFKYKEVS